MQSNKANSLARQKAPLVLAMLFAASDLRRFLL